MVIGNRAVHISEDVFERRNSSGRVFGVAFDVFVAQTAVRDFAMARFFTRPWEVQRIDLRVDSGREHDALRSQRHRRPAPRESHITIVRQPNEISHRRRSDVEARVRRCRVHGRHDRRRNVIACTTGIEEDRNVADRRRAACANELEGL